MALDELVHMDNTKLVQRYDYSPNLMIAYVECLNGISHEAIWKLSTGSLVYTSRQNDMLLYMLCMKSLQYP